MGLVKATRGRAARALLGLCATLSLLLFAAPAQAADEHVFDPTLSLRGDCTTNELDNVPDPGCPGTAGIDHPPKKFEEPCGTAVDSHGDIYVASAAQGVSGAGKGGRIDVFNPQGEYLTQIKEEFQPCGLAVDSQGNVYVSEYLAGPSGGKEAVLFKAKAYPPAKGATYEARKVIHAFDLAKSQGEICTVTWSVAVDPSNDHAYVGVSCDEIFEYDSAANGNALLKVHKTGVLGRPVGLAVYGKTHDIYLAGAKPGTKVADPANSRVFAIDGASDAIECEIDGTETPQGGFGWDTGFARIAIDQSNGDLYVDDLTGEGGHEAIDQFDAECGEYIGQIEHGFKALSVAIGGAGLALDAPCLDALSEPCGGQSYDSPNEGHLYVAQGKDASSFRVFAFGPKGEAGSPPAIEEQAVSGVTDTEAILSAQLSPGGLQTTYRFEYVTQAEYEASGYASATSVPVPEADGGDEVAPEAVSEPVAGLEPGTAYRFRLVATNCAAEGAVPGECLTQGEGAPGEEGDDAAFATYPAEESSLPDGRAYELVTPPDTNGRIPTMAELGFGFNTSGFNTALAAPGGGSVVYGVQGGSIPDLGGGGFNDTYEAVRGPDGWQSHFDGVSGVQAEITHPGGIAADHGFAFWQVDGANGSLTTVGGGASGVNYIRRPGGVLDPECSPEPESQFELVGCGSLGTEPYARGLWIAPDGGHAIFVVYKNNTSGKVPAHQLEPCAASSDNASIYDRTPDGVTHCLSVRSDGSALPGASYLGTSADGTVVAFSAGGTLYVRLDNTETVEAASGKTSFGGLSEDGSGLVYLRPNATMPLRPGTQIPQGDIYLCSIRLGPCSGSEQAQEAVQIGSGEESVLVNVSADGSHVYFTTPKQLDGGEGTAGKDNLYVWDAASETVRFIATLAAEDVEGRSLGGSDQVGGLGLWIPSALAPTPHGALGAAADPSRTTPDGSIFVFESHAKLSGYENAGHSEVYRFDAAAAPGEDITCLSCNPTGVPATSSAQLQSDPGAAFAPFPPVVPATPVANLSTDGTKAFFQSAEKLTLEDIDGRLDVYEWEAQGTGGCEAGEGCIHLISSGQSAGDDYLYAASPDGSDVFFESGDLLAPEDFDTTPSIYDAREGGGFPPALPPPEECEGEACQSTASPEEPQPASATYSGPGNPSPEPSKARCPKGKRAVRKAGKSRCVAKKPHKRPHHRGHRQGRTR